MSQKSAMWRHKNKKDERRSGKENTWKEINNLIFMTSCGWFFSDFLPLLYRGYWQFSRYIYWKKKAQRNKLSSKTQTRSRKVWNPLRLGQISHLNAPWAENFVFVTNCVAGLSVWCLSHCAKHNPFFPLSQNMLFCWYGIKFYATFNSYLFAVKL